jgi:hypothetical protein
LTIEGRPAFSAIIGEIDVIAEWSQPATVDILLANPGNVPVNVQLDSRVDSGTAKSDQPGPWHLLPGQSLSVPVQVMAGESLRSLGITQIDWRPDGGEWTSLERTWQASFTPLSMRIVRSNLDAIHVHEGPNRITAVVRNNGAAPAQAEVLAIVDGVLNTREQLLLGADEERQVALTFVAGTPGTSGHVELLVRPVGSTVAVAEPLFYMVGDVTSRNFVAEKRGPLAELGVPGLPTPLLAALLVGAAIMASRRRR